MEKLQQLKQEAKIEVLEELFPQWIPEGEQEYKFLDKNKDKVYRKLQELKTTQRNWDNNNEEIEKRIVACCVEYLDSYRGYNNSIGIRNQTINWIEQQIKKEKQEMLNRMEERLNKKKDWEGELWNAYEQIRIEQELLNNNNK